MIPELAEPPVVTGNGNSTPLASLTPMGDNRILIAWCYAFGGQTITSTPTANGIPMTLIPGTGNSSSGFYYLTNPDKDVQHDITFTRSGTGAWTIQASSWKNVNTILPVKGGVLNTLGIISNASIDVASRSSKDIVITGLYTGNLLFGLLNGVTLGLTQTLLEEFFVGGLYSTATSYSLGEALTTHTYSLLELATLGGDIRGFSLQGIPDNLATNETTGTTIEGGFGSDFTIDPNIIE